MSPTATSGDISVAALGDRVGAAAALFPADGVVPGPADSQTDIAELLPSDDALVLVANVDGAPGQQLVAIVNPALLTAMGLADAAGLPGAIDGVLVALAGGQAFADARVGTGTTGLAEVAPSGDGALLVAAGLFLGTEHVATIGVGVAPAGENQTPAVADIPENLAPAAAADGESVIADDAGPVAMDLPEVGTRRASVPTVGGDTGPRSLELLRSVEMNVTAELGRTRMTVADLLSLTPGSVVELDRSAGTPIDVLVNGTLIARGEVVVIDEEFGVRISEIIDRVEGA